MVALNKSLYTRLLKNKHVKRKEINRKKNAVKKEKILRELTQYYLAETRSVQETKRLIRKHGLSIPKAIGRDLMGFAGVTFFYTPDEERLQITRSIKSLGKNVIPKQENIFRTSRVARGSYVYIILAKGRRADGKRVGRTILIAFDKTVSKASVLRAFETLMENGNLHELDAELIDSPPLEDLLDEFVITSFSVVGLMYGA